MGFVDAGSIYIARAFDGYYIRNGAIGLAIQICATLAGT
jgi:hypothetical protein